MGREQVFISYNSADRAFVEMLWRQFEEEGIPCWYDASSTRHGASWVAQVEEALRDIRVVVVCIGAYGMGPYQRREVDLAISLGVTSPARLIIPVLLQNAPAHVEVPGFLTVFTRVDLRRHFRRNTEALFKSVRSGQAPTPEAPGAGKDCPYRGLKAFTEREADRFFGRKAQVDRLHERLGTTRLLTVVGASGSGKSSLVNAGLLPPVRKGSLAGTAPSAVVTLRPGPRPCHELAVRLMQALGREDDPLRLKQFEARLRESEDALSLTVDLGLTEPGEPWLLLVVDQLEEVFTQTEDEAERASFLRALLYAATVPAGRIRVVCTLRIDFMGRFADSPFSRFISEPHQFLLLPMVPGELYEAISQPALMSGVTFEDGLVDTLVEEVNGQPGGLPLLQFTLESLWQARTEDVLTWQAYLGLGRLKGAITRRAESLLLGWNDAQRSTARRLLGRLVQMGEHAEDTRRRVTAAELQILDPERDPRVLSELIGERLLTTVDGDLVEVAHEALIREWKTLQDWLREDREDLQLRQELGRELSKWKKGGGIQGDLLHGSLLQRAVELRARRSVPLSPDEEHFVAASHAAQEDQERRKAESALQLARTNRSLRRWLGAAVVAFTVAAVAFGVAFWARGMAQERLNSSLGLAEALTLKIDQTLQPVPGSAPVRKDILDQVIVLLDTLGDNSSDPAALRLRLFSGQQRGPLQTTAAGRWTDLRSAWYAADQLLETHPDDLELHSKQEDLTFQLAREAHEGEDHETAMGLYERYLVNARGITSRSPTAMGHFQQMNLASLYWSQLEAEQGHPMRARELLYQSLSILQAATKKKSHDPLTDFLLAQSYMELGRAQEQLGLLDEAATFYRWALYSLGEENTYALVLKPAIHELLGHVSMLQGEWILALYHFQELSRSVGTVGQEKRQAIGAAEHLRRHVGVLGSLMFEPESEQRIQRFYDDMMRVKNRPSESILGIGFISVTGYLNLGALAKEGGRVEEGQKFNAKAMAHLDALMRKAQAENWTVSTQLHLSDTLVRYLNTYPDIPRVQEFVDRNIAMLDVLLARHPGNMDILMRYSKLLSFSGERHEASQQLEEAWRLYERAMEVTARARQKGDRSLLTDMRIVLDHRRVALLSEKWKPKQSQSHALYLQAIVECEKALAKHPSEGSLWRELGFLHERIAQIAQENRSTEEAIASFKKSIEGYQQAVEKEPDNTESRHRLAYANIQLGHILSWSSDKDSLAPSEAAYAEALKLLLVLVREEPEDENHQLQLSQAYNRLGAIVLMRGEYALARKYFEEDLTLSKRFAASHPDDPNFQRDMTIAYQFLGLAALRQQRMDEARVFLEKYHETARAIATRFPDDEPVQHDFARAQATWCDFLTQKKDPLALTACPR